MRKVLFVLSVILTVWVSEATAQRFVYGGGLAIGGQLSRDEDYNEKMALGLNVHAGMNLPLNFSVLANLNYFFPSTPSAYDITAWQAAADVHYQILGSDSFGLYGLVGLNYSYIKEKPKEDYMSQEMYFGFDIGAGLDFKVLFSELKYDTGFDQFQASAGVRF